MEKIPAIYVDWNEEFGHDLMGLHCPGSVADIEKQKLTLENGMRVKLYGDDLEAEAIIQFDQKGKIWMGKIIEGTLKTVR